MKSSNYYILRWTDAEIYPPAEGDNFNLNFLKGTKPLDEDDVPLIKLTFEEPYKENIEMADYHPIDPVFSKKICEVLKSFNITTIQIFDAILKGVNNEAFDYSYVYVYKHIECMDLERSAYTAFKDGPIGNIKTIVLDEKKLNIIPLSERLIFRLYESPSEVLFYSSIVNAIIETKPKGIRFIKIEDYYDGIEFT